MPNWSLVNANSLPSHRDVAQAFHYRSRLAIIGGYGYGNIARRDILLSSNGVTFYTQRDGTPWEEYTPVAVMGDYIYAIDRVSVWCGTPNNIVAIATSPLVGLPMAHALLAVDNKLHLFSEDKVYTSVDGGVNFSSTTVPWGNNGASFSKFKTCLGKAAVFIGAKQTPNVPSEISYPAYTSVPELWLSATPDQSTSWIKINLPIRPRFWPAICDDGVDAIYLFGGFSNLEPEPQANLNDTWRWRESEGMRRIECAASPAPRHGAEMIWFNGRGYLYGGNAGSAGGNTLAQSWEFIP